MCAPEYDCIPTCQHKRCLAGSQHANSQTINAVKEVDQERPEQTLAFHVSLDL